MSALTMAIPKSCVPAGALDAPTPGESLSLGYAFVRGWALSDPRVSSVEIWINEDIVGYARLGMPRPDVAAEVDRAEAAVSGFEAHLDLAVCAAPGDAVVEAWVTRLDGSRYSLGPVSVEITPPENATRRLVEPATGYGLWSATTGESDARVVVFTHDLARGGAQFRMLDYLRFMAGPSRLQFTVVSQSDGPVGKDLVSLGIPVHICGSDGRESEALYEEKVQELVGWIAGGSYDLVWANTLVSFAGVDAALRLGLPSLFLIHEGLDPCLFWGPELATGRMAPHAYARCLVSLASASLVACVADAARRTFERYRRSRIVVLPNSIDVASIGAYRASNDRREARQRLGLEEMDRLVLSCAPVVPHKGQAVLAQAFGEIASAHPRTTCAMVGHFGHPYGDGIAAYVNRAGLEARICLESAVDDIYQWFLAADLFVLSSDDEALASVVLEAMAFGLPVLTTDVAGMPEVVEDGVDGYVCRQRNVGALAQALDKALSAHPAVLQSMAVGAMKRVQANHDIAAKADVLQGLIVDLAAPSAPPAGAPGKFGLDSSIVETLLDDDAPDGVGIDVALAIVTDLALEGVSNGSILHIGRGVGVSFALAEMGYSVTSLGLEVDGGAFPAWRRLVTIARSAGGRAIPRLTFEELSEHLSSVTRPYDAALLLGVCPSYARSGPADDACETLSKLQGRVLRAYVGLPCREAQDVGADEIVAGLAARRLTVEAEFVSSTVGLEGEPLRVYRFDLS